MSEQPEQIHCAALTRTGSPCKNFPLEGSEFCRIHQPKDDQSTEESAEELIAGEEAVEAPVLETTGLPLEDDTAAVEVVDERALRKQLMAELDRLIERVRETTPGYSPPPFSPRRLIQLVRENVEKFSPDIILAILEKLRSSVNEDLFDIDTWKGIWYMVNYSIDSQRDFLKRRLTGEYETDEWGLDMEFLDTVKPFFDFLYYKYWRIQTSGMENVPEDGRALLIVNHSGQLPWDGAMVSMAVYNEHPTQRLVRTLYATWINTLPFFSSLLTKMGHSVATEDNGRRLLEQEQLVAVFPEGYKGVSKLYKDRYRLARFGRGGFIQMALEAGAPIIPVSVVGAEETYISLAKSTTIARMIGFPYFPISITWPWLGPLGLVPLPTKWYVDFGEPIPMDQYGSEAAANIALVSKLTDQIRSTIQDMIYIRLAQRQSVFFG